MNEIFKKEIIVISKLGANLAKLMYLKTSLQSYSKIALMLLVVKLVMTSLMIEVMILPPF